MSAADDGKDQKAEELTAMVRAIRDRVRSNHPSGSAGEVRIPLADLEPLLHARDVAEGKVAAIGTVNPRASGPLNSLIQSVKRFISRALDWHVREQVEYNRALVECINAAIEALNESNRAVARLAEQRDSLASRIEGEFRELKDIRIHWEQWRQGWEQKLVDTEIQFLRGLSDIRGAFDQRLAQMDASYRATTDAQKAAFVAKLEGSLQDVQKTLWADLERVREEYEGLIHNELRVVRQRTAAIPPPAAPSGFASPPSSESVPKLDYLRFADRFRGDAEYVKRNQAFYVSRFGGRERVVDLGCGRGEFLESLQSAGIPAVGVDLDEESVNLCKSMGMAAEVADIFEYLEEQVDASLDGIFCSQVIEHLSPAKLPELVNLAASKMTRGGLIAFETPNPECLAVFATHFYLDPTHTRPVPSQLMSFYLEEAGFGRIEVHQLSPAIESMPSLAALPEEFRKAFFGGLDYAVLARRL